MAAFSNVNADGVPLNVSQAVRDDTDASNFASHLRGELTPAQKRDREYHTPAESLSTINEQVHELYDTLLKIKNNPENYTEEQINKALDNQDLLDRLNENYFSGNYQAKLGDREGAAYKYWRMYRSNKKNWDKRRDAMVAKEKKKLDDKGMKITDEMTPKQRREMRNKRQEALSKVRNKYNRGDLGQQINYLIGKINEILLEEPPRYKEDERFSAAAYVPSSANLKRQEEARKLFKGKSLPSIGALRRRAEQRKEERRKRMEAAVVTSTAKPKAEASAKPTAKPSAKQNWSSDKWRGPYKSRRNPEKRYLVRVEDELGVFLDDEGKLTERNIRKAEEHKAKKEAAKKAAKRKGGRRTRKKRGKGKQKKRESPKSKKKRDTTKDRLKKALERQQKERAARIAELRQSALVVPDDDPAVHSDNFAAGIFDPNAPTEDEFSSGIGLTEHEENEGAAAAEAVDNDDGIGWGQFSSEGFNGGRRKTRKKKGGIVPGYAMAELNHLRSRYIDQLEQRERLERELQECRQDLHNATTMDSAGVRESKSNLEGGRRKTRKMKGGHHLYKRLGVSKYASQKQIKKAYNKLKKKKKLTQKVKYAYKILSKKKSRKKYNAKYKKHKKHKNTKKRKKRKGGLPSVTVKAQIWPENYRPDVNVVNSNQPNVRTWTANLAN